MIGAITGDVVGSVYERYPIKTTEFDLYNEESRFTDDTVLSIAVADAILNNRDYSEAVKEWGRKYPRAGYGGNFEDWLYSNSMEPYNSWGNGSAMRVSSAGFAFNDLARVLAEAEKSAAITHNHPEGIKGAQATAAAVFLGRTGASRKEIKEYIQKEFTYDLSRSLDEIRPGYSFDVSCQGSVPEAIIAFLESTDYENSIRLAVSLGGDSDTIACITGGIAQAYYKQVPEKLVSFVRRKLPGEMITILDSFEGKYSVPV